MMKNDSGAEENELWEGSVPGQPARPALDKLTTEVYPRATVSLVEHCQEIAHSVPSTHSSRGLNMLITVC